ncbi:hypothetical protein Fot_11446 [Forsythia ovata]|uniref:Uncharacterized protein n=1 Tax=Forsythia ovata TaxID=205694 RepID=A0ABD1WJP6_9LAMI
MEVRVAPREDGAISPISQKGVTRLRLAFFESSTSSSSSMTLFGTALSLLSLIILFSLSGRWTFSDGSGGSSRGRMEEVSTVTFGTDETVVEISMLPPTTMRQWSMEQKTHTVPEVEKEWPLFHPQFPHFLF